MQSRAVPVPALEAALKLDVTGTTSLKIRFSPSVVCHQVRTSPTKSPSQSQVSREGTRGSLCWGTVQIFLCSVQTEVWCIMETAWIFLDVKTHQYSKLGHRKEN